MGVKKRRQWTGGDEPLIVGYCPNSKCGVPIHGILFRDYRPDNRGFISGATYTCNTCNYSWQQ